uniref:thioester reductase domain-containing protein n=1 Tax=Nonomuraea pusilla TaxID=46177 RepID=UPI0006E21E54|nr:thioester reductase domain-containing protein [Nonomuraea pusilla]
MAEPLPLLPAQEGIWTGQALDPGSPAYNAGEYVEIRGPLDTALFERALRSVIGAAQALHATFPDVSAQVITVTDDWELVRAEASGVEEAEAWMRTDLETVVDLARGPLFRQALLAVGPGLHLWYQRVHHIAADGYAFALLARRVAARYTALRRGAGDTPPPASLAPLLEEAAAYAGPSGQRERDREFWLARCGGMPAPPLLAPAAPAGRRVLRRRVELPAPVTPETLVAVTAAYLRERTGAGEAVLGLPVMNRLGSAALNVPCMAMNIVPLRVPVTPSATLEELTARAGAELRATRPHHRYRYEWLRRDLRLVGGDRRLFGPVVNVLPFGRSLRFGEALGTVRNVAAGPVEDLSIAVSTGAGEGARPYADIDVNAAAYRPDELDDHAEAWLALLRRLTRAPARPWRAAAAGRSSPGLPEASVAPDRGPRGRSLGASVVLDGGPLPVPAVPVAHLIAGRAAATPHAVAVEREGRRLTYRELMEAARTFADRLRGARLVAVMLPRGFEAITAIVGTVLAGAAYLPLDPAWPEARTRAVLADARPDALVTPGSVERLAGGRGDGHAPGLAYVMHTSGSTGRPKGVAVGHEALAHFVAGATGVYGVRADDRVLQFAPLHFDASVEEIFLTLCAGATLVLRTDEMAGSVPRLLQACADLGVTVLDLPTAFWHEVAYALSAGSAVLPPCVRTVVIGGEAALPERVARWHAAVRGGVRLLNTYGPTEATVVATVAELVPGDSEAPIGRPLPGVRAAVVDGELVLMGGGLARGYLDAPFPVCGGERVHRTGDLVRVRPDGQLVHLGRADDQFKISGHRVDPAEIESALLRHPRVREAAVAGRSGADGVKHLAAHVVQEPGPPLTAAELRRHLTACLPPAVIPTSYAVVPRIPRTPTGKIDRDALHTPPGQGTPRAAGPAGGPSAGLMRLVVRVWEDVLGTTGLSPGDDFFELGGHSLQAVQVVTRLSAALGHDVPAALLFRHPTAATLTTALAGVAGEPGVAAPEAGYLGDAVLPPDVPGPRRASPARPPRILLTGATGFVGPHLLTALLEATDARVVCAVRAPDEASARRRLAEALAAQDLPHLPEGRVDVVPADLAATPLTGDYAAVCHNAATVSLTRGYASVRAVNVAATLALLRLGAPFHHVSTLAVAPPGAPVEEAYVPPHAGLSDGYRQSKWVAEELVRQAAERGLPAAVHRLGRVVGAPDAGQVNPSDLFWRVLRAGIPVGALPDLDVAEPWTPVDYAARAVAALVAEGATGVHNLAPLPPVHLREAMAWVRDYGYRAAAVSVAEWTELVRRGGAESAATAAFFDLAGQPPPAMGPVRCGRAAAFPCPPVGRQAMFRYLDHCVETGLLPRPRTKGSAC